MITGGHYLEVLRLGKQMTIGRCASATPSYLQLHRRFVSETGGCFRSAFYRGFFPWGLFQCLKGVPVLFVQGESFWWLHEGLGWESDKAQVASGFLSGASQAFFVCPFQKVKVMVVADPSVNKLPALQASKAVIDNYGLMALYDGILPMMLRRSLDWGIRFTVSSEVKKLILSHRAHEDPETSNTVSNAELLFCGLVGGACSAFTHPIDNIITNSQRPMPRGTSTNIVSVVRRMWHESGPRAFTRGFLIKIVDNAYHNAW
eukprot:CAMPEP_0172498706 /NCGR_PEP_ID=MMETSP1066-20121228/116222_1 /TAXON_ID=671091 /ORGANISM="Coscinodiscus wailesii, Strain CCMP2513" /LENGTH=259 /DNA_ID=CAMNT_0013272103 /DNA_START=472 /DNA_END=1248 /DNA_ORIENTATION=-